MFFPRENLAYRLNGADQNTQLFSGEILTGWGRGEGHNIKRRKRRYYYIRTESRQTKPRTLANMIIKLRVTLENTTPETFMSRFLIFDR